MSPHILQVISASIILTLSLRAELVAQGQSAVAAGALHGKISASGPDDFMEEIMKGRAVVRYDRETNHAHPVQPYALSEKAVIYLESESLGGVYDSPAEHPQLNQRDMIFRPLVLPVVIGTTVDFPNNDNLFHNVFSYSQPKEFDLGRYPQGQKKSVRFDRPGIVKVYCDIHSYMFATILVLPNPFFAVPDDDGSYRLENIPPGTYSANFWYGRKLVETKTVAIRAGETTTINFTR